ncbi:NAD-dependent epimerase/dehydratase family protein [Microbacterium sp. SS28]|uniref:NAD-dependent epimerase/dehydratase family protein n=1 Tax=Microbacterium sp. SS28 TaxID=2919948 RepID=UPI001FAA6703|nr:NAD-dependent epimerase/dehydratase family protein [Microbacterium sp. SS28]
MKILLTGSTGYIGSAVLERLVAAGHDVIAPVRSARAAEAVEAQGARAVQGDVTDAVWFGEQLSQADAAVHAAAPSEGAEAFNASVVDSAIATFAGTGKHFVLTSGIWLWGAGADIDESTPAAAPALVAWRVAIEDRLLASDVEATVIAPGVVYGRGQGLVDLIVDAPRTQDGALQLIGDGEQRWTWVHVDDLARLYEIALESPQGLGRVIASDGSSPTVREIAESAAGADGVVAGTADAARDRFGSAFGDALLLDQRASGAKARALGWTPEHTGVLAELALPASVS